MKGGLDVLTGGTDTLLQLDLRGTDWTGKDAEERLADVKLTVNRNAVPFDEQPPTVASGVRIGTPAATMRGFVEDDFAEVGQVIVEALGEDADVAALAAKRRPLRQASAVSGIPRLRPTSRDRGRHRRLIVVEHPLVQHKLSYLREEDAPTVTSGRSRTRSRSSSPTRRRRTSRPRTWRSRRRSNAPRPADLGKEGRRLPGAPRRDGDARRGALARLGRARRLHRALPRRGDAQPVEYYVKLPNDLEDRDAIVLDPMLATGNSSVAAIAKVKDAGADGHARLSRRGAGGIERVHAGIPKCGSSRRRSTEG